MPGRVKREDSPHAIASKGLASDLKAARTAQGMTQQTLASQAGVSIGTIRKVEDHQVVEPGLFTMMAIAKALDYDLASFFHSWRRP